MTNLSSRKPRIFTLGHSSLTYIEFRRILDTSSIQLVVDVRSNPTSGRYPWFERHRLSSALQENGLAYRWFRVLGGRKPCHPNQDAHTFFNDEDLKRYAAGMDEPGFKTACEEIVGLAACTSLLLLGAEKDPKQCHRWLLSDKLCQLGLRITHILNQDDAEDHRLNPNAEITDGRLVYVKKQLSLI